MHGYTVLSMAIGVAFMDNQAWIYQLWTYRLFETVGCFKAAPYIYARET